MEELISICKRLLSPRPSNCACLAKEEIEKYKVDCPNKEKVYNLEHNSVTTEDKLLLSKLLKKKTDERVNRKETIEQLKLKMKNFEKKKKKELKDSDRSAVKLGNALSF